MGLSFKISLALLLCLLVLVIVLPSYAQNSPQDYLNAHNTARAQVGVGPMRWNETVAQFARNYANGRLGDCNLIHSGGPYGENLAKGSGAFTGVGGVNLWVAEKSFYNYNSNTCASGKVCGHYTQVVWRNSNQLGCFRGQCLNGWWFIICSYYPAGNIIGQRPYDFLEDM
ncbi:pathogenesis-related leaf protein 4-like [Impatiens glandulifera]|uniref:pathogenesis-related leaf protein 4-like n=1 Tax=Impatiens glandulifera TaxID=253017 RepID=UPI001FB16729|nr:pathogenesis-related leaf protein 4-like [Impatiens glandulifera]